MTPSALALLDDLSAALAKARQRLDRLRANN